MTSSPHGELIPDGGGNKIPLIRQTLIIGRRDSCDIPLRLPNVSGTHCEMSFLDGFWWIKDLDSTNGIKVNGVRVPRKMLQPGDKITIAKKHWTIQYQTPSRRANEEILEEMEEVEILNQPLLERAGLVSKPRSEFKRPAPVPEPVPVAEPSEEEMSSPLESAEDLQPAPTMKPAAVVPEPVVEAPPVFQPNQHQAPKQFDPAGLFLAEDTDDD